MGSVGPLLSPSAMVVVAVSSMVISAHVWSARAHIAYQLERWGRHCSEKTMELFRRSILRIPPRQMKLKSAGSSRLEKQMAKEAQLQQAVFERSRLAASSYLLNACCPWMGLILFLRIFLLLVLGVPASESLAIMLGLYCVMLLGSSGALVLTTFLLDVLSVTCYAMIFVALFFIPGPPQVLLMAPVRFAARAMFGLVSANTKLTVLCNIPISLVNIYKLREASGIFRTAGGQDPDHFPLAIACEVLSYLAVVMMALVIQQMFMDKVEGEMIAADMDNSIRSKKKLLSVLCDAHVMLGHDFRILGRCIQLSQMLMTGFGPKSKGLEGTVFTTLLAEIDQIRFRDFVAVSAGNENDDDKISLSSRQSQSSRTPTHSGFVRHPSPATSLHVNIRDAAGVKFPIELFHVVVCNMRNPSEPPSHLIGIREQPNGHEISTSFQKLGFTSEEEPGAALGEADVSAPCSAEPQTRVLSDLLPNKKATGSSSSQASSASGSSRGSSRAVPLDQADLPWIQRIEFQFDGMSDGFPLQQAKIYFHSLATTESSACPTMKDCLRESRWPQFRGWVQKAINDGMAGHGENFHPTESAVALQWPGRAGTVLCADEVQFRVEVQDKTEDLKIVHKTSQASRHTESTEPTEDAGEEEEEAESVAVWATMSGFHQYRNHEKKHSSRPAQSEGQAPTLAAIQEHDRRMSRASIQDILENQPRQEISQGATLRRRRS
ncbi:unnamed protein product [Polarella glacialis]|uniref:Uncharacterized protein n=1 Tax=Polarella glacialis TaxID=89957 RepID=A0A813H4R9_POLGL|nr:unnamed protein product [Polarella glacialis]CAE8678886.1 unnamed protein product [Polarella glacialis]